MAINATVILNRQLHNNKTSNLDMRKIVVLKLGSVCIDKATGLQGTVTHWFLDMGKQVAYLFEPYGINPEDGQPVKKFLVELERLVTTENQFEEVEVPFEIIGSIVKHKASGFTGMAIAFVRHTHGCFHVTVQPKGVLPRTNSPIKHAEFDLRECSGEKIEEMNAEQLQKSKEEQPSPTGDRFERELPSTDGPIRPE